MIILKKIYETSMQIFIVFYGSNISPSCFRLFTGSFLCFSFILTAKKASEEESSTSQQFPFDYTWTSENCLFYVIRRGEVGGIFMNHVMREGK